MPQLPDFWRVEVFHPLTVHAPLALLVFGTLCRIAGQLVSGDGRLGFLTPAGRLLLGVGAVAAWAAIWTGSLADGEVGRTLCDPTVAKTHENVAWGVAITFSCALPADLALAILKGADRLRRGLVTLVLLAYLGGAGALGYAGHLGATLVYQQGAAVYHPTDACTEFE
ncbi:MAG: DUF2231 domain-containing protein [Myxococcota bacterium]